MTGGGGTAFGKGDQVSKNGEWWPAPSDGDGAGSNTGLKRRGSGRDVSRRRQQGGNLIFQV